MVSVNLNKSCGFTLVEFLVSIVILSVGMLGLLQSVNYSIDHNMNTQLRDEAVRLADERMTTEKSRVFDAISTTTKSEQVKVNVNNAFKNYSVVKSATNLSGSSNTKIVQIDVVWKYKKARYSHIISSLVSKSIH